MTLSSTKIYHERRIYGWLDLLGDMGGVQGALCVCLEFLLLPIAEHCFILKVMKRLFLANSSSSYLFKPMKKEKKKMSVDPNDPDAARKMKNRTIKLSLYDNILLYISNMLGCLCFCDFAWPKKKKL